ncbi:vWA domain-containing protein [Pseudohoeflea coraliihabitans]|uniref:VWA domain-containing protein n=1 Tax=Pseudohoeflea coraliihabitans TaxID=2860393 RepID=A0ABS6WRM9_9HYPH|nr:VWA domain-containing protein [Pseudohoeflea sp. DP4N28-3]MBW3098627.1 VWA domain-containing protein [Pseudohoeflea sp. DP4N28-3]
MSTTQAAQAFWRRRDGNFAMLAATLVPICFAVGSLAIDVSSVMAVKARSQHAADAAALAIAARLSNGTISDASTAEAETLDYFNGEISNELAQYSSFAATPVATVNQISVGGQNVWQVDLQVAGSIALTPLAKLLNGTTMNFDVSARTESAPPVQNAFSMALVLDVSGSMDWYGTTSWAPSNGQPKKIEALRTAVSNLLTQIKTADPEANYSRIGGTSYNTSLVDYTLMQWGTSGAEEFTEDLSANGGTSSWLSFWLSYQMVKDGLEETYHLNKNGLTPEKFIVFMTDGDNNYSSSDTYTQYYCDEAKGAGITIYTVAFMAPDKGQALLSSCATDADHYFEAETADDLIDAFERIGQRSEEILARLTK